MSTTKTPQEIARAILAQDLDPEETVLAALRGFAGIGRNVEIEGWPKYGNVYIYVSRGADMERGCGGGPTLEAACLALLAHVASGAP